MPDDQARRLGWRNEVLVALILIFVGGCVVGQVGNAFVAMRLLRDGTVVNALVTEPGRTRRPTTSSIYQFQFGGATYSGRGWPALKAGERLDVSCLGADPSVNRPVSTLRSDAGFGIAIVAVPTVLIAWVAHHRRANVGY